MVEQNPSHGRKEASHLSEKSDLIHECRGKAEWSKVPACFVDVPNWREMFSKEEEQHHAK